MSCADETAVGNCRRGRAEGKGVYEMTIEEAIKAMQNIDLVLSVTESEHEAARMGSRCG